MKKLQYLIIVTALVLSISGCSDEFLNTVSPNSVSDATFWKTDKDIKLALTGCYAVLESRNLYNSKHAGPSGFPGLDYACDNGYMTWDYKPGAAIARGDYTPSDAMVNGVWDDSYKGITRCNRLIDNIGNVEESEVSSSAKARYVAEAKFLRALYYNKLAILFRDVPLITKSLTLSEAEVPVTNHSEIISFITEDLKSAVENLPLPQDLSSSEWGRATRGAGYALLADIYLNDKQYTDAAIYAKKVLDLNYYQLFPDYATLFSVANEQCSEVIFSVCFKRGMGGHGSGFGWFKKSRVPDNCHPLKNLADDFYLNDGLSPSESLEFNASLETENRDPRFDATLISKGSQWQGSTVPNSQLRLTGYALRKWVDTSNPTLDQNDADQDFYVFRLAHVILDRAEALVQSGNYSESEVLGLIDKIRERVNMPKVEDVEGTGLSQTDLMDIIKHERRVETAFEGRRYIDLKRWGMLKERSDWFNEHEWANNSALQKRNFIEPKHNVWPIPQSELDVNKALVQHPEW
ncbi:RagB/SusD family nutrient uptake outer membrane protein [Tenacibaculum sp. UWU-22]|uniref:RagB/SusD family nutrient uptake outer membrane protein n=1 Tax=Tenacibaculum sp. UWU-22 TaxID=3234187 RepID=UPI0034DB1A24